MTAKIELHLLTQDLYHHHLSEYGLRLPVFDVFGVRESFTENLDSEQGPLFNWDPEARWPGWTTFPHPAYLLINMKRLQNIRLLV
jgi:hypothetical protein